MTHKPGQIAANQAIKLVYGERMTHGDAEKMFTALGRIWAAKLGIKDIPPHIAASFLQDVKIMRMAMGSKNNDNAVDNLGYGMIVTDLYLGQKPS